MEKIEEHGNALYVFSGFANPGILDKCLQIVLLFGHFGNVAIFTKCLQNA